MRAIVSEWNKSGHLQRGHLFVIGCSTSEAAGEKIGTSGSEEIAAVIYTELEKLQQKTGMHLVFQCCEHLNRALVLEREAAQKLQLEEVSVIPAVQAGGSMATYAFKQLTDPVVVESLQAHAGIDIGDTMIGMHLKSVAVPLRFQQKMVGEARITAARTRPKLIGGVRACYRSEPPNERY
ncbi:TIGR01440 family protein [Virgibacillus sp. W0430]|uniref:TIGR01440 family protein n=1 Tax=Virgibacillus sp. W0430 TaxID=3391580 RepID=UPI003F48600B